MMQSNVHVIHLVWSLSNLPTSAMMSGMAMRMGKMQKGLD